MTANVSQQPRLAQTNTDHKLQVPKTFHDSRRRSWCDLRGSGWCVAPATTSTQGAIQNQRVQMLLQTQMLRCQIVKMQRPSRKPYTCSLLKVRSWKGWRRTGLHSTKRWVERVRRRYIRDITPSLVGQACAQIRVPPLLLVDDDEWQLRSQLRSSCGASTPSFQRNHRVAAPFSFG